jgi:hypothetical protein
MTSYRMEYKEWGESIPTLFVYDLSVCKTKVHKMRVCSIMQIERSTLKNSSTKK